MKLVQPTLDELLPTPEARVAFEEKSAALEAAELVRSLRRRAFAVEGTAGISQEELARRIGTSQARISQIEKGEGRDGPSYALLRRIAYACGIDWLRALRDTIENDSAKFATAESSEAHKETSDNVTFVATPSVLAAGTQVQAGHNLVYLPVAAGTSPFGGAEGFDVILDLAAPASQTWHWPNPVKQFGYNETLAMFKTLTSVNSPKDAIDVQIDVQPGLGHSALALAHSALVRKLSESGNRTDVSFTVRAQEPGPLTARSTLAIRDSELIIEAKSQAILDGWCAWAAMHVKAGHAPSSIMRDAQSLSKLKEVHADGGSVTVTLSDNTKMTFTSVTPVDLLAPLNN
jgi:DNA-binding XRE family transcriptional regulator